MSRQPFISGFGLKLLDLVWINKYSQKPSSEQAVASMHSSCTIVSAAGMPALCPVCLIIVGTFESSRSKSYIKFLLLHRYLNKQSHADATSAAFMVLADRLPLTLSRRLSLEK